MLVRTILKAKEVDGVFTIRPDATLADAAAELSARNIGALVVSETGRDALGILSERDIVRELGLVGPDCMTRSVSEVMTANPILCAINDTSDNVLAKMANGHFRHMPVMDGERMVALISIGDVAKAQLGKLAMEKDALQSMIMHGY